jgi:hypothetical protein
MQWTNNGNVGQVTLCDPSYSCYGYTADNDGSVDDYRTISYGRAKCHSYAGNGSNIFVSSCYTQAWG